MPHRVPRSALWAVAFVLSIVSLPLGETPAAAQEDRCTPPSGTARYRSRGAPSTFRRPAASAPYSRLRSTPPRAPRTASVRAAAPRSTAPRAPTRRELAYGEMLDLTPEQYHQAFDPMVSVYRTRIRLPNGRTAAAVFVPRSARSSQHDIDAHVVALEVNQLVGLDIVPPAAVRRDVTWTTGEGRVSHRDDGVVILRPENETGLWNYPGRFRRHQALELFHADARVLDALLNEYRANPGTFMMGDHWASGDRRPYVIGFEGGDRLGDQGLQFNLRNDSTRRGPLEVVRRSTLDGLRRLDARRLRARLGTRLDDAEIQAMLGRRDALVAHFDSLIAQRGANAVVIDAAPAPLP